MIANANSKFLRSKRMERKKSEHFLSIAGKMERKKGGNQKLRVTPLKRILLHLYRNNKITRCSLARLLAGLTLFPTHSQW